MHNPITRRHFVSATLAVAAMSPRLRAQSPRQGDAFQHGVASGDPLQDRVILWTRVTPSNLTDDVEVRWAVAEDPQLRRGVASGRARTDITRDFTVKVDVDGLRPGHTYYYQFTTRANRSPVGRTRTLPRQGARAARLALASCSNMAFGLFNVYALVARRADLDCVLHLGDYLYEYANKVYGDGTALGRVPVPDKEMVTLADYRLRHAQYKTDADLQEAHRQHPFICVWDDHELANDSWRDGAMNHNPEKGEGEYAVRKRAAIRAYFEWMPIRPAAFSSERIYRQFRFGELADLLMLDTRLHGRSRQSQVSRLSPIHGFPSFDPVVEDPARTLLGFDQEAWLAKQLHESQSRGARWRLLGQQVMMAPLSRDGGLTLSSVDQWGGYRAARERLHQTLRWNQVDNLVVMTGDIHSSWGNELTPNPWDEKAYDPGTGRGVLGVEFVTPAVSSPGVLDPVEAARRARSHLANSPHMKYVELHHRGYVLLDIDAERVQGEFWHVATVDAPSREEVMSAALVNVAGDNRLQPAAGMSAARTITDPAP
jgi:alkaline phosphatase D